MRSTGIRASCKLVTACLLTLLKISFVQGTAVSTDNSDIWTAHNEEAWGMQLMQRANVMFATQMNVTPTDIRARVTGMNTAVARFRATSPRCGSSARRGAAERM